MLRSRPPYAPEYRHRTAELVGAGRTHEELAREFEQSAQASRSRVAQVGRDSSCATLRLGRALAETRLPSVNAGDPRRNPWPNTDARQPSRRIRR